MYSPLHRHNAPFKCAHNYKPIQFAPLKGKSSKELPQTHDLNDQDGFNPACRRLDANQTQNPRVSTRLLTTHEFAESWAS